jgi:hypothetical protein
MVPASRSYSANRSGPIVEYTLQNIIQPIGDSTYRVSRELPESLQAKIPSIEDLEEVVEKLRKEMDEAVRRKIPMLRSHDWGARHEHALARREQPAGDRAVLRRRLGAAADGADERCFAAFDQ